MVSKGPQARGATVRDSLRHHLEAGWATANQLSSLVGISEKAVPGHLEHLRRSVNTAGGRFEVEPAMCSDCEFVFRDRDRLTRPSRCPKCRGERVEPPRFRVVAYSQRG